MQYLSKPWIAEYNLNAKLKTLYFLNSICIIWIIGVFAY